MMKSNKRQLTILPSKKTIKITGLPSDTNASEIDMTSYNKEKKSHSVLSQVPKHFYFKHNIESV